MEWLNVAIYLALVVGLAAAILTISHFLGPRRFDRQKLGPYECGVEPLAGVRERFSVHFYLVAILFVLFDIEIVFLIPWAVLYRSLGVPGLIEMGIFLAVLGWGLFYVWKRGALEWE